MLTLNDWRGANAEKGKKKGEAEGTKPADSPPAKEKPPSQVQPQTIDAAIEAEIRAAKERANVPIEVRVTQFKEMLKEKEVNN